MAEWTTLWAGDDTEYTLQHAQDLTRLALTDDHLVAAEAELRAVLGYDIRGSTDPLVHAVYTHERTGVARALAWLAAEVHQADAAGVDAAGGGPLVQSVTSGDQTVQYAEPTPLQAATGGRADYRARAMRELRRSGVLGRTASGQTHVGTSAPRWATSPVVNDI